jgi:hypothetical protein
VRTDIIQLNDNLKREVWTFDLAIDYKPKIRLLHFAFQTRLSTRHKWKNQNHWDRLMQRDNTMAVPPVSAQAVYDAKEYFIQQIKDAEVIT